MLFAIEAQNMTFKRELHYNIRVSSQWSNEDYFNFIEKKIKADYHIG